MLPFETAPWFEPLCRAGRRREFAAGDCIFYHGDVLKDFSILVSGAAEAMSYSEDGKETWVGEFLPGDFVGHNAFLDGAPQEFDLTAKTQTAVYSLPVAKVAALMSDSDALAAAIIEDFSRRLSLSDSSLIAAYTLSTKERICAELLRIAAPIGIDPGRHIIRPSPIFVDMARRVNSTRETVSRTVSELQKMGILSREPGAMVVHDTRHLKAAFR